MAGALKIGLIGAGRISRRHVEAINHLSPQAKLTAVCDVREDLARTRAGEAGVEAIYTDAYKLIREADIDAVDICTTHDQHTPIVMAAVDAGKHVLLEKPMARSMQECRQMVEATARAGLTFMIAQNQRYKPNYQAVRRAIQEGELGAIRMISVSAVLNVVQQGAAPDHWVFDGEKAGGGVMISLALHRVDLCRYFAGEIKRVHAITRMANPLFRNGAEDYACAMLEFENGAIGQVMATFSPFRAPHGETFAIYGDTGVAHALPPLKYNEPCRIASARRDTGETSKAKSGWGFVPLEPDPTGLPTEDMHINEMSHFIECVRTGQEPLSSGRDNLGTMRAVLGIYESARTGLPVDLWAL